MSFWHKTTYKHKKKTDTQTCICLSVIPERFERSTHALEGRCSIQLSYGTGHCDITHKTAANIVHLSQTHKA